ncbi:TIGR02530 family flagellar biosynthesis protein [Alkalicoccobacillus porphyridii]|uniref:Flagellar protein n=1 Tax=Alkalicoccobacillus porphyridii TaxID=2597270 RepID=A0A553ZYC8_9BACI|nr:TIGR02530 family flagellar biosynthesis protein [Alkalicoccobacillus porphyridii]TSB46415.1 hypothetical protein FN960_11455 [Alkalicoccobacillus porphyridii]
MINPSTFVHANPSAFKPRPASPLKTGFSQVFEQERGQLNISKHATERLRSRDIHLNQSQWNQIQDKLVEARKKGIKDALIVTNKAAIVASTDNQTVITVLNRQEAANHMFTNINGTILMDI